MYSYGRAGWKRGSVERELENLWREELARWSQRMKLRTPPNVDCSQAGGFYAQTFQSESERLASFQEESWRGAHLSPGSPPNVFAYKARRRQRQRYHRHRQDEQGIPRGQAMQQRRAIVVEGGESQRRIRPVQ